jgi:hypothetical protein
MTILDPDMYARARVSHEAKGKHAINDPAGLITSETRTARHAARQVRHGLMTVTMEATDRVDGVGVSFIPCASCANRARSRIVSDCRQRLGYGLSLPHALAREKYQQVQVSHVCAVLPTRVKSMPLWLVEKQPLGVAQLLRRIRDKSTP